MVNSISAANPNVNRIGVMDKVSQEQLYSPGYYSMPDPYYEPPRRRKHTSFIGFLANLVLTAAVIGGVAIGIRKGLMKNYQVADKLPDNASAWARIKNSFAKNTDALYEKTIGKLFKNKKVKTDGDSTNGADTKGTPETNKSNESETKK